MGMGSMRSEARTGASRTSTPTTTTPAERFWPADVAYADANRADHFAVRRVRVEHIPWPRNGGIWCAESPARKRRPWRHSCAINPWRWLHVVGQAHDPRHPQRTGRALGLRHMARAGREDRLELILGERVDRQPGSHVQVHTPRSQFIHDHFVGPRRTEHSSCDHVRAIDVAIRVPVPRHEERHRPDVAALGTRDEGDLGAALQLLDLGSAATARSARGPLVSTSPLSDRYASRNRPMAVSALRAPAAAPIAIRQS